MKKLKKINTQLWKYANTYIFTKCKLPIYILKITKFYLYILDELLSC